MTAIASTPRERPILFSGEMVRAILDARKTQTRRVVTPQPDWIEEVKRTLVDGLVWPIGRLGQQCGAPLRLRFSIGDHLWVRETWAAGRCSEGISPACLSPQFYRGPRSSNGGLWYAADDAAPSNPVTSRGRWRPSIHMPRWASRLTLEVAGVRVERLRDTSEADAVAEGAADRIGGAMIKSEEFLQTMPFAVYSFAGRWDALNAKRGFGWRSNPWVWVVEFKRIDA